MTDAAFAELLAGEMARTRDRDDGPADDSGAHAGALSSYLRFRLEMLRMSPTQFADRAGISRSTVYLLLGDRPPGMVSTKQLHKIAAALETDPRVLAELWHGFAQSVDYKDERDDLVRSFVLATSDLSYEELRAALEVARAAVSLTRRPDSDRGE